MDSAPARKLPASLWRRKKTYIWLLIGLGVVHAALMTYGFAHPPSQMGIQLIISFTLNVALLGWCYVDAEEKMIPITGGLGFVMLFVALIGVPWYFVRSRGIVGALKGGLGLGLFGIWFAALIVAGIVCATIERSHDIEKRRTSRYSQPGYGHESC